MGGHFPVFPGTEILQAAVPASGPLRLLSAGAIRANPIFRRPGFPRAGPPSPRFPVMLAFQIMTVVMLAALLAAEYLGNEPGKWLSKPLASAGFLGTAWMADAWQTTHGRCVLLALALCWLGDVLLIPVSSKRAFQAGIASFLLGHVAFAAAFVARGLLAEHAVVAFGLLALPATVVARWLHPHLPHDMHAPVYAYLTVITAMVAAAAATYLYRPALLLLTGAVLFYLSDLSVARDRFVEPSFVNRLWGLPFYYGAQLLLAASAGSA
jgi:uncharacterized membrane protein YhhN